MATPSRETGLAPAGNATSNSSAHVQQRNVSRDRIAEDMEAFSSAGGKIELLGNTPFRTKPSPEKPVTASAKTPTSTKTKTS